MKTFLINAARTDAESKPKFDFTPPPLSTYASAPACIGGGGMNAETERRIRTKANYLSSATHNFQLSRSLVELKPNIFPP